MVSLALATPVAKTCDAGGGALRSERREWPGTDCLANLVRAPSLRMPPSATSALLPSCPANQEQSGNQLLQAELSELSRLHVHMERTVTCRTSAFKGAQL